MSLARHPSVCLVLLTWNGCDDTVACLDSMRSVTTPHDVILVDNASVDATVDVVRARFPAVTIVESGWNAGFAEGNNIGLQIAIRQGYEVIGMLNNDTVVEPNFLEPLLQHLDEFPDAAVSPRIEYEPIRDQPWFVAAETDVRTGLPRHTPVVEAEVDGYYSSELLTGCCLLAKRETWQRVGLLDSRFFLIFEDSDWCIRAGELGSGLHVVPRSVIRHKVSTSFKRTRADIGLFYWTRNALLFRSKHRRTRPAEFGLAKLAWDLVVRAAVRDILRSRNWTSAYLRCEGLIAYLNRHWGPAPPRLTKLAEVRAV